MSTHNIQFHDKIRKNPYIFVFLSYWKDFVGTEKKEFELSTVNEPYRFEPLRLYCMYPTIKIKIKGCSHVSIFCSPEHKVIKVSYCDHPVSVIHHTSVLCQQFV